jgi:hypothetical protein
VRQLDALEQKTKSWRLLSKKIIRFGRAEKECVAEGVQGEAVKCSNNVSELGLNGLKD